MNVGGVAIVEDARPPLIVGAGDDTTYRFILTNHEVLSDLVVTVDAAQPPSLAS
jgi:hypothetical protein